MVPWAPRMPSATPRTLAGRCHWYFGAVEWYFARRHGFGGPLEWFGSRPECAAGCDASGAPNAKPLARGYTSVARPYLAARLWSQPVGFSSPNPFTTMDDFQKKQHQMCGAVKRFAVDQADELAGVPAAVEQGEAVKQAYDLTVASLASPIIRTNEVTLSAEEADKLLRAKLPGLLGPLAVLGAELGNTDLVARTTLNSVQLDRLFPQQRAELTKNLLVEAALLPAARLAHYGLAPAVLAQMSGYQVAAAQVVGKTQDLIDKRIGANASTEDLHDAAMATVRKMDGIMKVFKILNPALYKAYREARFVGKVPRKNKPGGGTTGPVTP